MLMGNDSQNKKRGSAERAASVGRRDSTTDTERKLSEARRLFSLREFVACETLLLQVLEIDPLNSKAKALSELTAIKLHRRKLYKKLVDPRTLRKPSSRVTSRQAGEGSAEPNLSSPGYSDPAAREDIPQSNQSLHLEADEDGLINGSDARQEASAPRLGSMRERTISALVQLLEEKDRKLEDWHDPRFGAASPQTEVADSSVEVSTVLADEGTPSPAIPWHSLERPQDQDLKDDSTTATETGGGLQDETVTAATPRPMEQQESPMVTAKSVTPSPIPLPSLGIVEEIRQLKHEPVVRAETESSPEDDKEGLVSPKTEKAPPLTEAKRKGTDSSGFSPAQIPHPSESQKQELQTTNIILLPKVSPFEQITSPKRVAYKSLVERKLEQRSEDLKNSEIKTVSIAQIKKYLYQEEYELCARELENIQKRFPDNEEIQAFVGNTSKRLSELQRVKGFETLAKELMLSASFHYQQGKFPEALIATNEVLRVIPEHQQARQFAELVQKRLDKEKKKALSVDKVRYCWACGVAVDSVSYYCHHCGHRLS